MREAWNKNTNRTKGSQISLTLPSKWGTELECLQIVVSEGGCLPHQPDSLELLEPER